MVAQHAQALVFSIRQFQTHLSFDKPVSGNDEALTILHEHSNPPLHHKISSSLSTITTSFRDCQDTPPSFGPLPSFW